MAATVGAPLTPAFAIVLFRSGRASREADLVVRTGHAIVNDRGPAGRSPCAEWLREHTRDEDVVYTGDGVPTVLGAVRSGLGISVLPCFAVADEPSVVRLTRDVVAVSEAFVVIPSITDAPPVCASCSMRSSSSSSASARSSRWRTRASRRRPARACGRACA